MSKFYTFLATVICSFAGNSQIVYIPDANFKGYLLSHGVDHNSNGEIDTSEALLYTNINLSGYQISDVTGIEAFTNLTELYCNYNSNLTALNVSSLIHLERLTCIGNPITTLDLTALTALKILECRNSSLESLDVSALNNLEQLYCSGNLLTELDLTNNTNLKTLQCGSNLITSLDVNHLVDLEVLYCDANMLTSIEVGALSNLKSLDCSNNLLTSLQVNALGNLESLGFNNNQVNTLDVTGLNNLTGLSCINNGMTSLDVSGLANLEFLLCSSNQLTSLNITNLAQLVTLNAESNLLTSLDFTGVTKLKNISLYENLFTILDFSPLIMTSYSSQPYRYKLYNNPNLTFLNIKNGTRLGYTSNPGASHVNSFSAGGCPNLAYICADESNFENIIESVPNAVLNSYCSFTPGGNHNTITGTLTMDIDNDGCDSDDHQFQNSKILIDDSIEMRATFTDSSGNYVFYNTHAGDFVVTPEFDHPYFTISPQSATITFADNNNNSQAQNFCITPNGIHNDVEITIIPLQAARPGFNVQYQLIYKNKGNQILSGDINLTFDDAILDFISAEPMLAGQADSNLNWSYNNLLPFERRTIEFIINVNSPQETPSVNIGDFLTFNAVINPVSGDETTHDNTFVLRETVIGSFDPNDKTCLQGATITTDEIGGYLHYLIRFENAGTAAAQNIVVADMIDAEKFDINSLQLVASSHTHITRISENKVEFIFEGINLPAGIDDEAGSHGYIAFKVKTKNTLAVGDAVSNTANIYFDYNFPVATNTATTTVTSLLATTDFEDKSVSVFPNPVKDELHINAKQNITSIQVYDFQGRLIETSVVNATEKIFNIGKNANGIYFIKIYTENGVKIEKIIKE